MIDATIERGFERIHLLTNEGYFNRFRELNQNMKAVEAWETLEGELPMNLRRFTSFTSFCHARKKESNGTLPEAVYFSRGRI